MLDFSVLCSTSAVSCDVFKSFCVGLGVGGRPTAAAALWHQLRLSMWSDYLVARSAAASGTVAFSSFSYDITGWGRTSQYLASHGASHLQK